MYKILLILIVLTAIPTYSIAVTQNDYNTIKKDMEYISKVKQQEHKELSEKNKQKIKLQKRDMRYNFITPTPAPIQVVK